MLSTTEKPTATICIPHWQVKPLITICLRAIRQFTRDIPIEVIVVDNGSKDESLDYLRSLGWIKLIERGDSTPQNWLTAYKTALDIGFAQSRGEYFIIMHSDTIIKRDGWLQRLIDALDNDPKCAASGAWKLEKPRPVYEFIKKCTDTKKARLWFRRTILKDPQAQKPKGELCPRDYCALYRAEPIRKYGFIFDAVGPQFFRTTAERMYVQLKSQGYHAKVIDTLDMMHYMEHLAHATAGMQPAQRKLNSKRNQKRSEKKLRRFFDHPAVKDLAGNTDLDHSC